jgi:hypothetical protein
VDQGAGEGLAGVQVRGALESRGRARQIMTA